MLLTIICRSSVRTLEKFRDNQAEDRHKKEAAVLQLEQKQTLLQVDLREANRKVKQGEEEIRRLQSQLVSVAQTQQRQEEESTEQLKKELRQMQERLGGEVKHRNELSEANQSLKEVSGHIPIYSLAS